MDPVLKVTFVTVKLYVDWVRLRECTIQASLRTELDRSTVLAMKNGPFKVALSELTTIMLTGLGSPAENVQVMTLLVFATLQTKRVNNYSLRENFGLLTRRKTGRALRY